jgi:hypothetical protein
MNDLIKQNKKFQALSRNWVERKEDQEEDFD